MNRLKVMIVACALVSGGYSVAEDQHDHSPYKGSAEFERLKSLAGTWQGSMEMNGEEKTMTVTYRVTSAGSAVVETSFPDSPMEMVSVYTDTGGKPGMTHYCAMKNRPNLSMKASDKDSIQFDFTDSAGIDPARDAHMHALTIRFDTDDRITQDWVKYREGGVAETTSITLERL